MEEIDVDGLMNDIESARPETFPMTASEGEGQEQQQTQQPETMTAQELAFTADGKEVKVPYSDERLKQWASMGYNYAQRMAQFNQTQTQFETERKAIQALKEQYGPVDDYVKQNPDFWNHVLQSWQQRQGQVDPNNPLTHELKQLKEELSGIKQFKDEISQEREAQKMQAEDKALEDDIQSIQSKYSNLDWKNPDGQGKTLEYKVLEYASQNGIRSFKTAFHDFYHDHLVKYETERAKETATKTVQANAKNGLLGKSQAPTKSLQRADSVKGKSYEALAQEALEELGLR